jgi:TPR repeat protein
MDNMGELYTQGIGVEKDDAKALGWFLRAAARGHGLAMCKTGLCFLNGQGTSPDPLEAYIWLQKGIENGYNVTDHRDAAAAKLTPDQLAEAEKRLVAERAKAAGTA